MTIKKDFRNKVVKPYKKRKKLLDLNILEKYKINKKYLIIALFSLIIFMYNKKFFTFAVLTFFSAIFTFYHSKWNKSPIDFKLTLFLSVFITRIYGIHFTFIFFILSDIVPQLLGGESLSGPDLFFIGWFFIVNMLVYLFPNTPFLILGPILVIVESVGAVYIHNVIAGIPGFMTLGIQSINILTRITYFLLFADLLELFFLAI
ncbi:hypothetical protein HOD20_09995 [archaeon]|jgi:hypothetical protein|nr:hypothetical protein [archaeon]